MTFGWVINEMTKYLIDSHIFIWADSKPLQANISPAALTVINNTENEIYLSMVSLWEIQIKMMLGKLTLSNPLNEAIQHYKADNMLKILPIQENHIFMLNTLPDIHKDPFDRLIIAQAIVENLPIITVDSVFKQYPVELFDASVTR